MSPLLTFIYLASGLAILVVGADLLIKGASSLAKSFGVPPLVIGLTIVAFGTSSPELTIGIISSLKGESNLALGNVVGSNIANILLILGLSALIYPIKINRQIIRSEVPFMILSSFLVWLVAADKEITRLNGSLLFLGFALYTFFQIRIAHKAKPLSSSDTIVKELSGESKFQIIQVLYLILGLGGLAFGSKLFVDAAVLLAKHLGVSELVIGLTIVSIGTSLPEIVTSLVAAYRKESDIAVGNVIGSCIFNSLSVLGLSAIFSKTTLIVPDIALNFDIPVMVAASIACLPIFFSEYRVGRWEGALFLGYYIIYTLKLILEANGSSYLPIMQHASFYYIIPLTVLVVSTATFKFHKKNQIKE
ncbi:MAG: calcium/sodium antiporter [Bdellovibrionota bacterium]